MTSALKNTILIIMMLIIPSLTLGADIKYVGDQYSVDGEVKHLWKLHINGEITQGDFNKLAKLINLDLDKYLSTQAVEINSYGGDLGEAIKIGELLGKTYKTVNVGSVCASSCFFIYIGAVERKLNDGGRIGIHRPYFSKELFSRLDPAKAKTKQRDMMYKVRNYLTYNNVPQAIIDKMFTMSSAEIHWLTDIELHELGSKSAWYEEYLTAKCKYSKKQDNTDINDDGSFTISKEEIETYKCKDDFVKQDARKYLTGKSSNKKNSKQLIKH
jgi:ATP-dependent protease ClpP protease subunit